MPIMPAKTIEVFGEMTTDDWVAFHMHFFTVHSPEWRRRLLLRRWGMSLLMVALGLMVSTDGGSHSPRWEIFIGSLLLAAAWILVYPFNLRFFVRRRVLKLWTSCQDRGPECVRIDPGGLEVIDKLEHSRMDWQLITDVAATESHVFLYKGPLQAVVVPRRYFAHESEFRLFVETARNYYEAAHGRESRL